MIELIISFTVGMCTGMLLAWPAVAGWRRAAMEWQKAYEATLPLWKGKYHG